MSNSVGDGIDMSWHADRALLSGYARGDIEETAAMSLENHVLGCSRCRTALGRFAERERLQRGKEAVLDSINSPRLSSPSNAAELEDSIRVDSKMGLA